MHTSAGRDWPFLSGGGEAGRLIAGFDWSGTSIGPLAGWPACLRSAVALMLRSQVPMVVLRFSAKRDAGPGGRKCRSSEPTSDGR